MDKCEKNLNKNNNTITFLKNYVNKNEYIFKKKMKIKSIQRNHRKRTI